jgi:quinoprotein glucose dehydrogenase
MIFYWVLKNGYSFLVFSLLIFFILSAPLANEDWRHSSGSSNSERYSELNQINKKNIQNLEIDWNFYSGKISKSNTVQTSPIFTGRFLINVNIAGDVVAINPLSGDLVWRTKLIQPVGRRGITFDDLDQPLIYVATAEGVVSLDEDTGDISEIYKTGKSLLAPILTTNQLTVATLNDGIKAFNRYSGEQIWHFSLEDKSDNPSKYSPRIWSGFSYDAELNVYYVVTGNPGGVIGVKRTKPDLSVSLIAVSGDTGELLWYYQHIEHDLWDFDLVGPPIITSFKELNNGKKIVIALSKTGEVIVLDAKNGESIYKDSISKIEVQNSDIKGEITAKYQKVISTPEPFSRMKIEIDQDFNHLDDENKKYVLKKIRHSKSDVYLPPSLNYDVITYGLHGGAEWPGGSLNLTLPENASLVVPFNNDPWIIRVHYQNSVYLTLWEIAAYLKSSYPAIFKYFSEKFNSKSINSKAIEKQAIRTPWAQHPELNEFSNAIFSKIPFVRSKNRLYNKNCSSCHGNARQGMYQNEKDGDLFYPPLTGITLTQKYLLADTKEEFKWLHEDVKVSLDFTESEYHKLFDYFKKYDERLLKLGLLKHKGHWQQLIDSNGFPATKPPWGGLASINLNDGKLRWKVPFGVRKTADGQFIANGDKNFGGVLSTASDIIFAGGTPDEMVRAFDGQTGEIIWERKLPYAASAPPISYLYKGCQYVVFNATGGRFHGFVGTGNATVAFKLDSCVNFD